MAFTLGHQPFAQQRTFHAHHSQQARASQPPLVVRAEALPAEPTTEAAVLQESDSIASPLEALPTTDDCSTYQPLQHCVATAKDQPQSSAAPTFEALLHRRVRRATRSLLTKRHSFHSMGLFPLRGSPVHSQPLKYSLAEARGRERPRPCSSPLSGPARQSPLLHAGQSIARRAIVCMHPVTTRS